MQTSGPAEAPSACSAARTTIGPSRELPDALDRLERGEAEQLVITRRSQPRAVLITVERYEALLLAESSR